jgi:hypothetical protein
MQGKGIDLLAIKQYVFKHVEERRTLEFHASYPEVRHTFQIQAN